MPVVLSLFLQISEAAWWEDPRAGPVEGQSYVYPRETRQAWERSQVQGKGGRLVTL